MKRGARIGRPKTEVNAAKVRKMRIEGATWETIAGELRVARTVCQRALSE